MKQQAERQQKEAAAAKAKVRKHVVGRQGLS
jgi:hypothetical protein